MPAPSPSGLLAVSIPDPAISLPASFKPNGPIDAPSGARHPIGFDRPHLPLPSNRRPNQPAWVDLMSTSGQGDGSKLTRRLGAEERVQQSHGDGARGAGVEGTAEEVANAVNAAVDLSKTEDTTWHRQFAPAVTHETVHVEYHEIRQERISRDVHHHHVYHRVLPIVEVELRPARHWLRVGGGYIEIPESDIPAHTRGITDQIISDAARKLLPESAASGAPRQFTARKFEGTDGDFKEHVAPNGTRHTETWWIHPPTVETGGKDSEQTRAFHFESDNPKDDGLRNSSHPSNLTGSPTTAPTTHERMSSTDSTRRAPQMVIPIRTSSRRQTGESVPHPSFKTS